MNTKESQKKGQLGNLRMEEPKASIHTEFNMKEIPDSGKLFVAYLESRHAEETPT
jgi:hypothetical protein